MTTLLLALLPGLVLHPQGHPSALPEPYRALESKALAGDLDATLELARDLDEGDGLPKDPARAFALFKQAASAGSMEGLEQTGYHELSGIGTAKAPEKALESFRKAALLGSGYAAQQIAWMYERGEGLLQSDQMAVQWYQRAVGRGQFEACGPLGWLIENGRGAPKDDALAAKIYLVGASHGDSISQDNLGWLCVEGRGVTGKNYGLAMSLFQASAKQGNARAEGNLGYMYEHGLGVPADESKALEWYRRSASHGDLGSQEFMILACLKRPEGIKDPEILHFALQSADQGSAPGLAFLAIFLVNGGMPPSGDRNPVFRALKKAAERGSLPAWGGLGICYLKGIGTSVNRSEAQAWLTKIASSTPSLLPPLCAKLDQGLNGFPRDHALAEALLDAAARSGNPTAAAQAAEMDRDPARSLKRLEALSEGGNPEATFRLGLRYQNGDRAPLSAEKAVSCFERAASAGNPEAMYQLGLLYQAGLLVKPDLKLAADWYAKAKAAHFPLAASRFNADGSLAPLPDGDPGPGSGPRSRQPDEGGSAPDKRRP